MRKLLTVFIVIALLSCTVPSVAATLEVVGGYKTGTGGALDAAASGEYLFVAAGKHGLKIYDSVDPEYMEEISVLETDQPACCVAVGKQYLYVLLDAPVLLIVDIANVAQPAVIEQVKLPDKAKQLAVTKTSLILTDGRDKLYFYDLTDPAKPRKKGNLRLPGAVMDLDAMGDFAYAVGNFTGLQIIDCKNLVKPSAAVATGKPAKGMAVTLAGNFACVVEPNGNCRAIDISDPLKPMEYDSFKLPKWQMKLCSRDNVLFAVNGEQIVAFRTDLPIKSSQADAVQIQQELVQVVIYLLEKAQASGYELDEDEILSIIEVLQSNISLEVEEMKEILARVKILDNSINALEKEAKASPTKPKPSTRPKITKPVKSKKVTSGNCSDMDKEVDTWIGTPYFYGKQQKKKGTDCSGYVLEVMKTVYNMDFPHSSKMMYKGGDPVKDKNLQCGDFVFFNTLGKGVSHVGLYHGDGIFSHASSSKGVTRSKLDNVYWSKRYLGAKRYLK